MATLDVEAPLGGIYFLTHAGRRLVYVGSTRNFKRRWSQYRRGLIFFYFWQGDISLSRFKPLFMREPGLVGLPSFRFRDASIGTLPHDWRFSILESVSYGVDRVLLEEIEFDYVRSAKAFYGDHCLNVESIPWREQLARSLET